MSSKINVDQSVPPQMIPRGLNSSSSYILRRRFQRVSPSTTSTDYSFNGNSRIEFVINSASDFWDYLQSYMKCNLTTTLTAAAGTVTPALPVGGLNSVFREIRVETSNSTVLQRLERYNSWYSWNSLADSQEHTNSNGLAFGDSVDDGANSVRNRAATTSSVQLCFNPLIPFLQNGSYIPLFLMRGGIRIIMELADPADVVYDSTLTATAPYSNASIVVSKPEFICRMVQPDNEIAMSYLDMFNSEMGINYTFQEYRIFENDKLAAAGGNIVLNHQIVARSACGVYTVLQNYRARTKNNDANVTDTNSYSYDGVSSFVSAKLQKYQYFSGSDRFPTQNEVDCSSTFKSEAYVHFMNAMGKYNTPLFSNRFTADEWHSFRTDSGNSDESTKLVLAADLKRGKDAYSGLDLTLQPLNTSLTFDAGYVGPEASRLNISTWIAYDSTVTISKDGIITRS